MGMVRDLGCVCDCVWCEGMYESDSVRGRSGMVPIVSVCVGELGILLKDRLFATSFLYNISLLSDSAHSSASMSELAISRYATPGQSISKVCFFSGTRLTATTSCTFMNPLGGSRLVAVFSSL